ncbi:MAG: sugar ABC transporter substrate-binding protein [Thermoanaerobaculia bacterium]
MRVLLATLLLTIACANPAEKAQGARPVRIGFSMDTLKEERWARDKALVEQRAREVGATVEVQVANGDDAVQTKQCENLLTKGIDVLIVVPHNGEIASSIVDMAHRRGVPVIAYDRMIRNAPVDLHLAHGQETIGELQAGYALEHVPRGNYVLIGGAPTDYSAILYRKAQMRVLQPAIDRGDIRIISQQFARDWRADEALRITEDALLRTGRKIDAIVASNDGTAGGAISALEAAGVAGRVLVTGLDAEKIAVQRIVRGVQTMTIYTPIKPLAFGAVDAALKLARKEPIEAPHRINNGTNDVPSILYDSIVVDRENLDATIIADGYHSRKDVYGP